MAWNMLNFMHPIAIEWKLISFYILQKKSTIESKSKNRLLIIQPINDYDTRILKDTSCKKYTHFHL